jgi:antitoxin (DNA-binding transcriptional repressor) of toxin-antitoxin stability system
MSHMKEISIRELHRNTGAWVRSARKYGSILIRDRNTPVATLMPVTEAPAVNRFDQWKPRKEFAAALDRPVGGTSVEEIIGTDRDR